MNKAFINLLSLMLFLTATAIGQDQTDLTNLEGFDKFVDKVMKEWDVPGMGVSIVRGKEVIFAKGYGYRNVEK